MISKLIVVGGGKGGVGKSLVAAGLIDTAIEQKRNVLLIESDTSVPDVYKAYNGIVKSLAIDLDNKEGWITLLDALNDNEGTAILNTGARNDKGVKLFGSLLMTALPELKCQLETLWVIGRDRSSVELLANYMEAMKHGVIHVVRNTHYGDGEKFQLYNESTTRKKIESAGGKTIDFPDLADRVANAIRNGPTGNLAISKGATDLSFGDRIELSRWRSDVWISLGDVV